MHFKTCTECNALIPLGTTECPHCKEPQSKLEYILISIGIVLVIALFGYSASFISFEEPPKAEKIKPIIEIRKVVGKKKYLVDAYLKEPTQCKKETPNKQRCLYQSNIEIVFLDERADWIKIEKLKGTFYSHKALELLNLTPIRPTLKNEYVMTWHRAIRGIHEVSIFGSNGNVSAIHINATRY
jgi:hypothetical protein